MPNGVLTQPTAVQIGHASADNVISSAEVGRAQTVTASLLNALASDVVRLFMIGVQ